jgi:hypothetical protein
VATSTSVLFADDGFGSVETSEVVVGTPAIVTEGAGGVSVLLKLAKPSASNGRTASCLPLSVSTTFPVAENGSSLVAASRTKKAKCTFVP